MFWVLGLAFDDARVHGFRVSGLRHHQGVSEILGDSVDQTLSKSFCSLQHQDHQDPKP